MTSDTTPVIYFSGYPLRQMLGLEQYEGGINVKETIKTIPKSGKQSDNVRYAVILDEPYVAPL